MDVMMKHLTVRNIPDELASALEREKHLRRVSLNQIIIELLSQKLGVNTSNKRSNGLAELAGTWSEQEFEQFNENLTMTEEIEPDLWR
jgi:hypothetical protein